MKVNELKELQRLERRLKKEGNELSFMRWVILVELRRKNKATTNK